MCVIWEAGRVFKTTRLWSITPDHLPLTSQSSIGEACWPPRWMKASARIRVWGTASKMTLRHREERDTCIMVA